MTTAEAEELIKRIKNHLGAMGDQALGIACEWERLRDRDMEMRAGGRAEAYHRAHEGIIPIIWAMADRVYP